MRTLRLRDAEDPEELLMMLSHACWRDVHDARCPEAEVPDQTDLVRLNLADGAITARLYDWSRPNAARNWPQARRDTENVLTCLRCVGELLVERLARRDIRAVDDALRSSLTFLWFSNAVIMGEHERWLDDRQREHPLRRYVMAWLTRPRLVEPETRADHRLLPKVDLSKALPTPMSTAVRGRAEHRSGQWPVADIADRMRHRTPPALPLFADGAAKDRTKKDVPLLSIVDMAGVPVMARGRGVPIPLRLVLKVLLAVQVPDRDYPNVHLRAKLAHVRRWLFPSGWQRYRDWPRLRSALSEAHSYGLRAGNRLWRPVVVREQPCDYDPEGEVLFDVLLPPGSGRGPRIDLPALDALMVNSAPRLRAYIAAHTLAWTPGKTRVPTSKGQWAWSKEVRNYPVLTALDRRELAFGYWDNKNRTRAGVDAPWRDSPGLLVVQTDATDPETGEIGWRVLPRAAAIATGYAKPT